MAPNALFTCAKCTREEGPVSALCVRNNRPLRKRLPIRNTGGDTLPLLTTALLPRNIDALRHYPRLSSIRTSVTVLHRLKYHTIQRNRTIAISTASLASYTVPSALVQRVHSSVIFLKTVVTHYNRTALACPNNYRLKPHPVSLRLSTLQQLNIAVRRRNNRVLYRTSGKLQNTRVALSFPDMKTARGILLTTYATTNAAILRGTTHRPRVRSLYKCLITYKTHVTTSKRNALIVRNIPHLRK